MQKFLSHKKRITANAVLGQEVSHRELLEFLNMT